MKITVFVRFLYKLILGLYVLDLKLRLFVIYKFYNCHRNMEVIFIYDILVKCRSSREIVYR